MSLLSREELRVVLSRDQVQLVHIGCELTLQGWLYRVLNKRIIPCTEDAQTPWANAVKALELALAELPGKPTVAQVILSNYFMHYAMVPWSDSLSNDAEELAFAKHCFSQLFGTVADSWELRVSQDYPGVPQFASGVDAQLLQTVRALFASAKIQLKSVQPYLMAAYNNCQAGFKSEDAWFVLYEQGNLCMGLVQNGHLSSVRTIKVGGDWLEKLPQIIDREAYLSEIETTANEIFLWAPEHWGAALPKTERWKIHKVQPMIQTGFATDYDAHFALAMCA